VAPSQTLSNAEYYKLRATIPAKQAFRPLADSTCPFVKK
jgi:branched-chain amino acid transport system substrate-binding protein